MKHLKNVGQLVVLVSSIQFLSATRSFLRSQDPLQELHIRYLKPNSPVHIISNPHLRARPLFGFFNEDYFYKNLVGHGPVTYRDGIGSVSGDILNAQLEELMKELDEGKKEYKHFIVLKGKEYYNDQKRGFLVVKFKDYPFVAKIFIETPEYAFVPRERALQAYAMYIMNGGLGRFEVGFYRIKTRNELYQKLIKDPLWAVLLDVPEKRYWISRKAPWMIIKGYNFGTKEPLSLTFPSSYAVIADLVAIDSKMSLASRADTQLCLEICRSLDFCIDPNISNFVLEKCRPDDCANQAKRLVQFDKYAKERLTNAAARKARRIIEENKRLVIIDTENFHDLVGIQDIDFNVHNYMAWYIKLAIKFINDKFLTLKSQRRILRTGRRHGPGNVR